MVHTIITLYQLLAHFRDVLRGCLNAPKPIKCISGHLKSIVRQVICICLVSKSGIFFVPAGQSFSKPVIYRKWRKLTKNIMLVHTVCNTPGTDAVISIHFFALSLALIGKSWKNHPNIFPKF